MLHECPSCGYTTRYKCAMKAHLNRKTPCAKTTSTTMAVALSQIQGGRGADCDDSEGGGDIFDGTRYRNRRTKTDGSEVRCDLCGRGFNHRSALCRHKKTCNCGRAGTVSSLTSRVETDMAQMKDRYEELSDKINNNDVIKSSVTIYNTHINNNSFEINAFGRESVREISQDLLDTCLRRTSKGLLELVDHIRFDAEQNRNRNVRACITHPDIVEYHDGKAWQYGQKSHIVKRVVEQGHEIMQEHFDDHSDRLKKNMSHSMFDFVCSWLQKMERNNHIVYTDVMAEVYLLILNRSRDLSSSVS